MKLAYILAAKELQRGLKSLQTKHEEDLSLRLQYRREEYVELYLHSTLSLS
jgi:hypothetical protein